MDSPVILINSL